MRAAFVTVVLADFHRAFHRYLLGRSSYEAAAAACPPLTPEALAAWLAYWNMPVASDQELQHAYSEIAGEDAELSFAELAAEMQHRHRNPVDCADTITAVKNNIKKLRGISTLQRMTAPGQHLDPDSFVQLFRRAHNHIKGTVLKVYYSYQDSEDDVFWYALGEPDGSTQHYKYVDLAMPTVASLEKHRDLVLSMLRGPFFGPQARAAKQTVRQLLYAVNEALGAHPAAKNVKQLQSRLTELNEKQKAYLITQAEADKNDRGCSLFDWLF